MAKTRKNIRKNKKSRRNKKYRARGGNIQNTVSKPSKIAVVYILSPVAGFFALYSSLWRVYLYAKKINAPFFIEHNNWQYTYKDGWHDYFKSLNVFNENESKNFDSVERFNNNPINDIMRTNTVAEYIQAIKETFILNDSLQEAVESYIKGLGGNYTSLYVRRGDKSVETPLISLDAILSQTSIVDDGRTIFVQTDDYSVVKDMKTKFPSCKIMTLTKENATGSNNGEMVNWPPEQRKEHTDELLMSSAITARANIGWTYYMSNVGTFLKLLGYDTMNVYIDDKQSREDVDSVFKLDHKGPPGLIPGVLANII